MRPPFEIAGEAIAPGTRRIIDIPLSMMSDHTPATLSVEVIHGRLEGPTIFISAAVHGDEILGVEIVRRITRSLARRRITGTVLLIPIVNMFGFISQSRYFPDRRDLNRSFPGSAKGSLAARLANLFLSKIVNHCDYGIDLHSAAVHRENFPQIQTDLRDTKARNIAKAFGAPIIVNSALRPGSLRLAARECDVPVIVFEAGEGLRFDEYCVRVGVNGVLRVLSSLGMITRGRSRATDIQSPIATQSTWSRADEGGLLRAQKKVGQTVLKGDLLGVISDPFGNTESEVRAQSDGLIIGRANLPVVNQGDALFHIAALPKSVLSDADFETPDEAFDNEPLLDEDEIH